MTLQPSQNILSTQTWRRHHWCTVYRVERRDGVVLTLTDHDREVEFEGETYTPVGSGSLTAEAREAQKESELDIVGVLDSSQITADDIRARRYVGAKLRIRVIDWLFPWKVYYETLKTIENIRASGLTWRATVMGITRQLQDPVGSNWYRECDLVLGSNAQGRRSCRVDLSATGLDLIRTGVGLDAVTVGKERMEFDLTANDLGVVTAAGGVSVQSDAATKTFTIQSGTWKNIPVPGSTITTSGFVNGGNNGSWTVVTADETVITVEEAGQVNETASATITFPFYDDFFRDGEVEWETGANAGLKQLVGKYDAANRRITLYLETPFDITDTDTLTIRPGCDGTRGTCKAKFQNLINFGQALDMPGTNETLRKPT